MDKVITADVRAEKKVTRFSAQDKLEHAGSGSAKEVGEGLHLGDALIHLDPALIWEILEQLESDN